MKGTIRITRAGMAIAAAVFTCVAALQVQAAPLPGGTLDPLTIPKYVTPLVIPPVMPNNGVADKYSIAVREFQQQILPTGFAPTKVWSYGSAADPVPAVAPAAGSSFNYPAFTVETTANTPVDVRWLNELVAIDPLTSKPYPPGDPNRNYLTHLFAPAVDQTLHWANPPAAGCVDPMNHSVIDPVNPNHTDCRTLNTTLYAGPVPIVTHVHGAHVEAHSDGYPEAWWLPAATNTPAGYSTKGTHFGDASGTNPGNLGYADYAYRNDQPATTLWYHDHSLGVTRLNVYAGPAGFWLVRGGVNGDANVENSLTSALNDGILPGPAPVAGDDPNFTAATRNKIREIPVVIQDRSFNADGSLFYPASRTFFDGFAGPYIPNSDISPIWNPEAFFNTMVVNGSTWPTYDVAPDRYRFRLLNGTNSRALNLAIFQGISQGAGTKQKDAFKTVRELPFYQIGGDQGFLPSVVMVSTGFATSLPGDGTIPAPVALAAPAQALLLGPAERADVIVDFSGLPDGTIVRMFNTAPDAPFGGFPDVPADPSTTGQVMQFVVRTALLNAAGSTDGTTTLPQNLQLPAEAPLGTTYDNTRQVSLNEMMSDQTCVQVTPSGRIRVLFTTRPNDPTFMTRCMIKHGVPMGPREALLGTFSTAGATGVSTPLMWHNAITETPALNSMESWEIFNLTVDAHPIHLHLVKFQVIDRQPLDPLTMLPTGVSTPRAPTEAGYKDTVVSLPGQVTRIKAIFDIAGLYVWHCHILEHEDNEMMRPYRVQ